MGTASVCGGKLYWKSYEKASRQAGRRARNSSPRVRPCLKRGCQLRAIQSVPPAPDSTPGFPRALHLPLRSPGSGPAIQAAARQRTVLKSDSASGKPTCLTEARGTPEPGLAARGKYYPPEARCLSGCVPGRARERAPEEVPALSGVLSLGRDTPAGGAPAEGVLILDLLSARVRVLWEQDNRETDSECSGLL